MRPRLVANGDEAWRYLQSAAASSGPVLAILDWMMPKMDGVEICRRVRHELPLANMYLILLTDRTTGQGSRGRRDA